jgi:osmotically-inducible protein OsmY
VFGSAQLWKEESMAVTTALETDTQLRDRVQAQLEYDPEVEDANIAVSVEDGVVTLAGFAHSYAAKLAAERAAKRLYGVRAVANDIEVRALYERTDPDIARDCLNAVGNRLSAPEKVTVTVRDGFVILEGEVPWLHEKFSAESSVRYLRGVRGATNNIVVKPAARPLEEDVKRKIEEALRRSAEVDARRVRVEVTDGSVRLFGNVRSWVEKEEAQRAASLAPGVTRVEDHLVVTP